jgi:hypothetical protein
MKLFKGSTRHDEVSVRLDTDFRLVVAQQKSGALQFQLQAASDVSRSSQDLGVQAKAGHLHFSHLVEIFGSDTQERSDTISIESFDTLPIGKNSLPSGYMKSGHQEVYWAIRTSKPFSHQKVKTKRSSLGFLKDFLRPLLGQID